MESFDGIRATATRVSPDGNRYRVVLLSSRVASVLVEGFEDSNFQIVAGDGEADDGGITMAKIPVIGGWLDAGVKLITAGLEFLKEVKCYRENTQVATFDPKTGNMTGFRNETRIVCAPPS